MHDVQLLLEGRQTDLAKSLRQRMEEAAAQQEYERAARYRDMLSTVAQLQEKQRMAAAEGDDQDVFGYHYENDMLAVNVFHLRGGKILDRREFFWEELPELAQIPAALMKHQKPLDRRRPRLRASCNTRCHHPR